MAQFPAVIDLAALDAKHGLEIAGGSGFKGLGSFVASAGDLNGDGFNDLLLASYHQDYVIFGGADGIPDDLDLTSLDATQGFAITGANLGGQMASAGDINGDGLNDIILAAGRYENYTPQAVAYVVFGSSSAHQAQFDVASLNGDNGFQIHDSDVKDANITVSAAGDINGDGFADLVVGVRYNQTYYTGTSYILFGQSGGFAPSVDLANMSPGSGIKIIQNGYYELSGVSVTAADVNGDGFQDLLIGSIHQAYRYHDWTNSVYVVFGGPKGFPSTIDLDDSGSWSGFSIDGLTVASGGDFNGDGVEDILAATHHRTSERGEIHVVFGGPQVGKTPIEFNGTDGFTIVTPYQDRLGGIPYEGVGAAVSFAGDVNGDGFDDIIVGSSFHADAGAAYVIFGRAGPMPATISVADLDGSNGFEILGATAGDMAGRSVSSAGDVNHDGLDDILVGADGADGGAGAAYIIYGQLPTDAVHRVGTVASQTLVGGDFDDVLSGKAGDDVLWGHKGDDTLLGGGGHDTLIGGNGADVLRGGGRKDVFLFNTLATSTNAAPDIIEDLGRDRINLKSIDADTTQAGDQAFHLVSAFTGHAGELALTYHASGAYAGYTTIQADVDGDGQADMTILALGDHHDFSNFAL